MSSRPKLRTAEQPAAKIDSGAQQEPKPRHRGITRDLGARAVDLPVEKISCAGTGDLTVQDSHGTKDNSRTQNEACQNI
jgi:hypothetical protein